MPEVPDLVTLRSGELAVTIDTRVGARAVSWRIAGLELLARKSAVPEEHGMYPMAPWAGRLRGNAVATGGDHWELPVTYGEWAMHGTVLGRGAGHVVIEDDAPALTASFDDHPAWPWPMSVSIDWRLSGSTVSAAIVVSASDESFPAVVGWHPWFRRRLDRGAEATWSLDGTSRLCRGPDHLPTGDAVPFDPADGPFDDAFLVPDGRARISWPGAVDIAVETDSEWFVVYDEPTEAFCVEPQSGPPDGLVIDGRPEAYGPVRWARPGAPLSLHTRWTVTPAQPSG